MSNMGKMQGIETALSFLSSENIIYFTFNSSPAMISLLLLVTSGAFDII